MDLNISLQNASRSDLMQWPKEGKPSSFILWMVNCKIFIRVFFSMCLILLLGDGHQSLYAILIIGTECDDHDCFMPCVIDKLSRPFSRVV